MKNFYITTTLPYINSRPHIGFALELIQADVIARYKRAKGFNVFFNTGTDEHGTKIYRKAKEQLLTPKQFADKASKPFRNLKDVLNVSFNNFIRTTDSHHIKAAQYFWSLSFKNGDIYKKKYKGKYCVGCEMFKRESDLKNGRCPLHPHLQLEIIEEENYFFRFSRYEKELLAFYKKNPRFVLPEKRYEEIIKFIRGGLKDFSISRLKSRLPWGIPVPNDENQVMFVWFDALINYISALGWPEEKEKFEAFWPGLQIAGKDNLRQQAAMWQAMLFSAGLPPSRQVLIHGFVTSNGQKMSKSLGNVVDPLEVVEKYGTDALRYFLLRESSPFEDLDFTYEKFERRYEDDLAKGLGNLLSRLVALVLKWRLNPNTLGNDLKEAVIEEKLLSLEKKYDKVLEEFKFNEALTFIWQLVSLSDEYLEKKRPWQKSKENEIVISNLVFLLEKISQLLYPFLPAASKKILSYLKAGKRKPLFPSLK